MAAEQRGERKAWVEALDTAGLVRVVLERSGDEQVYLFTVDDAEGLIEAMSEAVRSVKDA